MICQNLGVLCLQWSVAIVSIAWTLPVNTNPRLVPPEIIEGPKFQEFFEVNNDRKDLPCNATGTPPIEYRWLFNGVLVQSGDLIKIVEGRLHINNPTRDMEGYYQCRASNEAGVAISNITFLQAAVFETFSARDRMYVRPRTVKELDHVVLPCNHVTRSIPPTQITWELSTDGGKVFVRVILGNHVTTTQNGSLVFSFVRRNNSAIYKCEVYNWVEGYVGGSRVNLTIEADEASVGKLYEAPELLYSSPDVTVLEGGVLNIECLYGAWPDYEVEWTSPSGVTNVSRAWLIPNVTAADAGVYSCRARKMVSLNSQLLSPLVNISVQVDAIPTFSTPMRNQEVPDSGRDVTFRCQGQGRPSPQVTWYINGTSVDKLEEAVDHSVSGDGPTSVLVLSNTRTSATVTCNISNAHGYRLQSAVVIRADPQNDADNISTSSSHNVITTSAYKQPSTKMSEMTPEPYRPSTPSTSSTTLKQRTTTVYKGNSENDKINTNDTPAPIVVENSPVSMTTVIIIVAVVVVALVVVVVVTVIIIKKRRQTGNFALTEQVQPLRVQFRVPEHIYDSDDSGFDDLKAEHERRALQGHQPS